MALDRAHHAGERSLDGETVQDFIAALKAFVVAVRNLVDDDGDDGCGKKKHATATSALDWRASPVRSSNH